MQKVKPKTLPGFMELLPEDQIIFNELKDKIRESFELYGYSPLDTPIIEAAEILLAKTGGETSKQIYSFTKGDTDLALRFDLTVPLAKYIGLYQNDLVFPFKRYQIGKVYRGEKPQKGRYREFYQCDIDIVGKGELDLYADAEIVATTQSTFEALDIGEVLIRISNRKILTGLLEFFKLKEKSTQILRIIDKLDKLSKDKIKEALIEEGMTSDSFSMLMTFISIKDTPQNVIEKLKKLEVENATFTEGLNELEELYNYLIQLEVPQKNWEFDLSVARGLDYYTGTVYETILKDYPDIGSVCSGGRYDNLSEYYSDQKLPGVGVSIGLTRLFYKLREAEIIKNEKKSLARVLIVPLDEGKNVAFATSSKLRAAEIPTQVYFGKEKSFRKKIAYGNAIGVDWLVIIGEDEVKQEKFTLKNMVSGEQSLVSISELVETVSKS